jgi:hypothetical protein
MLSVAKVVTSHEGEGEFDPGQSSKPTDEMDVSMSESMSDARGSGYESEQSSHAAGGHADSAEADGDDEEGHMQNLMKEEDQDGLADDLDSDDSDEEENEEEVLIPSSLNQDFSTAMTVDDDHDSAWEYHQNNISTGATYSDKRGGRRGASGRFNPVDGLIRVGQPDRLLSR